MLFAAVIEFIILLRRSCGKDAELQFGIRQNFNLSVNEFTVDVIGVELKKE